MISLRTKDDVTEVASSRLLAQAPDARSLAVLDTKVVARLIYPAGFYKTKATNLKEAARRVATDFGGKVPASLEELVGLPGVGRKTANLVLGLAFSTPAICVDTHVHRIANRIGAVETKAPEATELALQEILPKHYWIDINTLLVNFGKSICTPVSPHCTVCPWVTKCPRIAVEKNR